MYYLIVSKKILFYETYNNCLFQELVVYFPSIHHRLMCLPLTHHEFKIPPTRIKPRPPLSQGSALTPLLPTKCQTTSSPNKGNLTNYEQKTYFCTF